MNIAVAMAVFPVILLGELPDKTMAASFVMATRAGARSVWFGAAAAFLVHVAIATTIGMVAARLLPQRITETIVAALFALGASLMAREAWREHRRSAGEVAAPPPVRPHRTVVTAFTVVFAAEWGDLTQVLTANLAAQYHAPLSVAVGALLALWSAAGIAVTGGQRLARMIRPVLIRGATATMLAGLAAYSGWLASAAAGWH